MAREFAKSFYKSKEWQQVRQYVLIRDQYLCVKCGKPAKEVHHKIHLNETNIFDPKVNLNPSNLISLCKDCHFKEHIDDKYNGYRAKLEQKENNKYIFDDNGYLIEK